MRRSLAAATWVAGVAALTAVLPAQPRTGPTARVVSASRLTLPGRVDSNNPFVWIRDGGMPMLTVLSSWGGIPTLARGRELEWLRLDDAAVAVRDHPGHGVWFEAVVPDAAGRWYGFYHHERPADDCGRPDRQLPRLGAARSIDEGRTWQNLGIVLDAPPGSAACTSANRFVLGGVGDVAAMLDAAGQDLYLYFSQYRRARSQQGVAVARLAWADRDAPAGRLTVWNDGAWLPATAVAADDAADDRWAYPAGTPLVAPGQPFHDATAAADVFWGPSIHWNTYLRQYVMLLNRAKDDEFGQDGIYVSYASRLNDPAAWSRPVKILNGGGWYPQVAGLERGAGTDRLAGRRARLFLTGASAHMIEFER
ncbi:MAG: hypothetical protein AB7H93_13595 [Vicinamibacterales bacterium]